MWKGKKQCEEESVKHNELIIEVSLVDANEALKHQPHDLVIPYSVPTWSEAPCHQFELDVLKDGVIKQLLVYEKDAFVFGRMNTCDFVLGYLSISRFHVVLQFKENRTFINKIQVDQKMYVQLYIGDCIHFL